MAESKKKATKAPVKTEKPAAKPAAKKVAEKIPAKKEPVKPAVAAKAPVKTVATKAPAKKAVEETKASKTSAKKGDAHSFNPEYLVLMQKDPNWMQAFWDVNDRRVQSAVKGGSKLVLRLYDVANDLTIKGHRERVFRDFEVPNDARSWYVQNNSQSGQMTASLGAVGDDGSFHPLIDSSKVVSFGSDGQYLGGGDDLFIRASLGGLAPGGFGSSALGMSSGQWLFAPSSFGSSQSQSSWAGSPSSGQWSTMNTAWQGLGKDFFLWVKTRLIVYGGTRPDAHLQVRGEHFPLNPDGTFSFEQDLPDSTQVIPVFATDKDGDFPTTIVPIVVKRTE